MEIRVASHCSQCGREDQANQYNEGYSSCCNKRICGGLTRWDSGHKFGIPSKFVRACCWAKAEVLFGGNDKIPEGSYQLGD